MKKYSGYFLITDLDGTLLNTNKEYLPLIKRHLLSLRHRAAGFLWRQGGRRPAPDDG